MKNNVFDKGPNLAENINNLLNSKKSDRVLKQIAREKKKREEMLKQLNKSRHWKTPILN